MSKSPATLALAAAAVIGFALPVQPPLPRVQPDLPSPSTRAYGLPSTGA